MKDLNSNSVTVSWDSNILRGKGIERLFLGVTSTDSKGTHIMLSSRVESETLKVNSLSPFTEYRLTMRESNEKNHPIGLGMVKTWPLGKTHLIDYLLFNDSGINYLTYGAAHCIQPRLCVTWLLELFPTLKLKLRGPLTQLEVDISARYHCFV